MTEVSPPLRVRRLLARLVATVLVLVAAALAGLYAVAGAYGFNVLFRTTCGRYELAVHDGRLSLLYGPRMHFYGPRCWEMPIVLAVVPK